MKAAFSLAILLLLPCNLWAKAVNTTKREHSAVEKVVAVFNASAGEAETWLAALSLEASASDQKYLENAGAELHGKKMPHARAVGSQIFLDGLESPLQVVDLAASSFRYGNKELTLDPAATIEENMKRIMAVIEPKGSAMANLLVPEARASFQLWANGFSILGLSMLGLYSSCNWFDHSREKGSCGAYALSWPFVNAAGGILAVARPGAQAELPAAINCRKQRNGSVAVELVASDGARVQVSEGSEGIRFRPRLATEDDGWAYSAAAHLLLSGCTHAPDKLAAANPPLKGYTSKRKSGRLKWRHSPQKENPMGDSSTEERPVD